MVINHLLIINELLMCQFKANPSICTLNLNLTPALAPSNFFLYWIGSTSILIFFRGLIFKKIKKNPHPTLASFVLYSLVVVQFL